eukprot:7651239-Pyramimonas_sp.AAC.1
MYTSHLSISLDEGTLPNKNGLPGSGALRPSGQPSKRPPGPRMAFRQALPARLGRSGRSSE